MASYGETSLTKTYLRLFGFLLMVTVVVVVIDWNLEKSFLLSYPIKLISYLTNQTVPEESQQLENIENFQGQKISEYLIDTPGCRIPKTAIIPAYFKTWRKDFVPKCDFEQIIATFDDEHETLTLLPAFQMSNYTCNVTEIHRIPESDRKIRLSNVKTIKGTLNMSQKEYFVTQCNKYLNFEANLPISTSIQKKLDHWSNVRSSKKLDPVSVILIGFDTTSRSQVHRSLPKTVKLMQELNFFDFQGFHSICPYTNDNFNAFLMGLETKQMRATCAKSWAAPYDNCPLIWEKYSAHNHVTMYAEDGSGTFNWGNGGGFMKQPTDFYLHPLHLAIPELRKTIVKGYDSLHHACTSSESVPKYQLRYLKRFLQKFSETPHFTFTFFGNPFHDKTFALAAFDDSMESFFKFLKSSKNILENSLIILLADHGERNGEFVSKGYEGFMEKSLPTFFLRLPNILRKKFPHFEKNLKTNTKKLTTAFDVHHTFLHLLRLQDLNFTEGDEKFQPVGKDRSSLFVPIVDSRSCLTVPIVSGNCICNSSSEGKTVENPFFIKTLYQFAVSDINQIVKNSSYKNMCSPYKIPMLPVVSAHVTANGDNYFDTNLRFDTYTGAKFEVRLRAWQQNSVLGHIERLSHFQRLDLYKKTSFCVRKETAEDKLLAELCDCKHVKGRR